MPSERCWPPTRRPPPRFGLSWTAFCLLPAFTTNVIGVCHRVVGRRTGDGDGSGAWAARQALLLAFGGGAIGLAVDVAPGAAADFALLLIALSKIHQAEQQAMDPLRADTGLLPPVLRALALGLLVETVVPLPNEAREESPVPPDPHEGGAGGNAELWHALHGKCCELSALVLRADDPGQAAAYVQRYLAKHLEYVCGVVRGQKRRPVLAPT